VSLGHHFWAHFVTATSHEKWKIKLAILQTPIIRVTIWDEEQQL